MLHDQWRNLNTTAKRGAMLLKIEKTIRHIKFCWV